MRFPLKDPMLVYARVKGPNDKVREFSSVLDFNSPYCVIPPKHAVNLGCIEAAFRPRDWQKTHPNKVPYFLDLRGIERSILLKLPEVSIGRLTARNVQAIVLELEVPRAIPFDLILGRTFLDNFKLVLDGKSGFLSLS
ncbi:MAG: hypothetical protein JRM80_05450 [Nitrososphaerota archaeon]|nr:hypothetical protein [Nitrososphaerota archaeon]